MQLIKRKKASLQTRLKRKLRFIVRTLGEVFINFGGPTIQVNSYVFMDGDGEINPIKNRNYFKIGFECKKPGEWFVIAAMMSLNPNR